MFYCHMCPDTFSQVKRLIVHLKHFHEEKWSCGQAECGRKFRNSTLLTQHLNSAHKTLHEKPNFLNSSGLNFNSIEYINESNDVGLSSNSSMSVLPKDSELPKRESDFENIFRTSVVDFVMSLHETSNLNRKHVYSVLKTVNLLVKPLITALSPNPDSILKTVEETIKHLSIEKNLLNAINGQFIKPEQFVINSNIDKGQKNNKVQYKKTEAKGAIIPLYKLLKSFFELPNVFSETLSYMNYLKSSDTLENFIQGDLWKKKLAAFPNQNSLVIPYFLYVDDWEPDNALGSHKKCNSIAASYLILPTIPPKYASSLENILPVQLFKTIHKKFADDHTYIELLKHCIYLEKEGIELFIDGKYVRVYFLLGSILGDNLGIHEILGFSTSFMANYNCIICTSHRDNSSKMCSENPELYRNFSQYQLDIQNKDISSSGIKYECIFNKLPSYHALENYSLDLMHVIYEGVVNYDVACILNYCIFEKKFLSLTVLNEKKSLFDYGINDIGNISVPIEEKHIFNSKFNMSASEIRCFIFFFPLILGEYFPKNDPVWNFLLKLIQIIDIAESKSFNEEKIILLKSLIEDHHKFYVNFFKLNLKPKHHLMLHFPLIIKQSGPLINLWCMRGEAKHKECKSYSNNITCRVNLPYSILMKQQLKLAQRIRTGRGFSSKIEIGPISKDNLQLMQNLRNQFPSDFNEKNVIVNWVKLNGSTFTPGLVINITSQNFLKQTVEIKHCISKGEHIYFVVFELNIEKFVSHYQSFKLHENSSNILFIVNSSQVLSRPASKHFHKDGIFLRFRDL